jgi:hypothetical protein
VQGCGGVSFISNGDGDLQAAARDKRLSSGNSPPMLPASQTLNG